MEFARVVPLGEVSRNDVAMVGGKNASLGELLRELPPQGVRVPSGFATTAYAYCDFLAQNALEGRIARLMKQRAKGGIALARTGAAIRKAILAGRWPVETERAIRDAYRDLCREAGTRDVAVAVRSSATAEDLPNASFAGQQESFLNVRGELALLEACRKCYASLYTDRAISYREAQGFADRTVSLSIGVQRMIRADRAGAGVMFTLDTESGFDRVVLISASWGLGESIVQGTVEPDEYHVFKPLLGGELRPIVAKTCGRKQSKLVYGRRGDASTRSVPVSRAERTAFVLDDDEILGLARWAVAIERHYGCPMDVEWAKDGRDGELFILQARPETVQSRKIAGASTRYVLTETGERLVQGEAIGDKIAVGPVCRIDSARDIDVFVDGSVLVTQTTNPDWVPVMKRAAAIVTEHGGRTSHAAIVSRELGLPAIVGASGATALLHDREEVTVSCAEGDRGAVYAGRLGFTVESIDYAALPATRTKVMLNLADPASAYRWWRLPADGVGLARMEFVVGSVIRIHPMALVKFDDLSQGREKALIARMTQGYTDKRDYFVDRLTLGLARIAAVQFPRPAVIRMSDFKTNEYARLIGGKAFEPVEENPMLGFRGASRYYSELYREGFALECRAIRRLREELGLTNVVVMIPFCRTPREADRVLDVMGEEGLKRGRNGLQVYVMCEIPSNVVLAREFAARFDGFSIGSNDLTQLTLGIDRDSEILAPQFDEQDEAVRWMIDHVIDEAHASGAHVGLCGQAPSDHPEFARFLVERGIDSVSVTPDSFVAVKRQVAAAEAAFERRSRQLRGRH